MKIFRSIVPSPCVRICELQPGDRVCRGCGRTAAEIANWTKFTDDERRAVLERLAREHPPKH